MQENAWYDLYGDIKPQVVEANIAVTDDDSTGSDIWDDAKEELFFDTKEDYEFSNIEDAYEDFY